MEAEKCLALLREEGSSVAFPESVEPLPFHAMSGYPYGPDESYPDDPATRRYREQYNTRRVTTR